MTIDELKEALLGKEFPSPIELGPHMRITDVANFLRIQFTECDQWKSDITKSPAYERLLKFYEAVK